MGLAECSTSYKVPLATALVNGTPVLKHVVLYLHQIRPFVLADCRKPHNKLCGRRSGKNSILGARKERAIPAP